jgi:hypothetical protein
MGSMKTIRYWKYTQDNNYVSGKNYKKKVSLVWN